MYVCLSSTMCIYSTISSNCNCTLSSEGPPILDFNERSRGHTTDPSTYTPWNIHFIPAAAASELPSARQPVFSAIVQSSEGINDSLNIQKRPPHVVYYWFDLHGLSLDPASSESKNSSSSTTFLAQFPPYWSISEFTITHIASYWLLPSGLLRT